MGTLLRRDVPGSLRAGVLLLMGEEGQRAWGALQYSVETGKSAFEHVYGMGPFDYYAAHPEAERSQVHDCAMAGFTALVTDAIVRAYDFSRTRMVIDVGGGNGALLAAILRANPTVRGIVYDLPHVVAGVAEVAKAAGVDDRCAIVAGSFFESVPEGGDMYVLKRIIHDWDDDRARAILTACRRAMKPGARLLVVDEVLPQRAETPDAAAAFLLDLEMLVGPGGRERTEDEFRTLLAASGLALARVVPAVRRLSIVESLTA
jgi:SAM-dependent methyltransferase